MEFQTDKEIEDYCIVKLVIQPILENAIYYGVGNMDEDDEGKITVRGEKKEDNIYIIIEDNGMGMRKEVLENILKDNNKVPKHGSGVGVINVHSRIQLMFGEQYGWRYIVNRMRGPGLLSIYRQFHIQRRMRNNWRCRNIYRGGM